MPTITQHPRGLVSLTGLRDMGEAPKDLSNQIVGTIDIVPFLLLNRETLVAGTNMTALGQFSPHTVPVGELWYVHAIAGISAVLAAGNTIRASAIMVQNARYFPVSEPRTATAGELLTTASITGFWVGPGVSLGIGVESFAGAAVAINVELVITRLRI